MAYIAIAIYAALLIVMLAVITAQGVHIRTLNERIKRLSREVNNYFEYL